MLSTDLLSHYRRVSQQLLTVVDVETTGHAPAANRVIEVSVLQASLTAGIQYQQTDLLNPEVPVPDSITRFTGISQAMVEAAPATASLLPGYLPRLNQGILTAHNISFDYGFLKSEFDRLDQVFYRPAEAQLCTVILARLLLPELPSRSLPALVSHFGFAVGKSHRAEADTLACWLLAERLLAEIQHEADEDLLQRFVQQWLPLGDAAAILQCTGRQARARLEKAGIKPRLVGRHRTPLYLRRDVERVFWEYQEPKQLSWL